MLRLSMPPRIFRLRLEPIPKLHDPRQAHRPARDRGAREQREADRHAHGVLVQHVRGHTGHCPDRRPFSESKTYAGGRCLSTLNALQIRGGGKAFIGWRFQLLNFRRGEGRGERG